MSPLDDKLNELQNRLSSLQSRHIEFANQIDELKLEISLLKEKNNHQSKNIPDVIKNEENISIKPSNETPPEVIAKEELQSQNDVTEYEYIEPNEQQIKETEKPNTEIDSRFVKNSTKNNEIHADKIPKSYTYEEFSSTSKAPIHEKYKVNQIDLLEKKQNTERKTFDQKSKINAKKNSNTQYKNKDETTGIEKLIKLVVNFFTEGNPVVRIGMVILFFGLSFLTMYAASKGYFPIEFRLSIVTAIAISLIVLGWRTRTKEGGYGLVLQGGGVASLYLTFYASAMIYHVISSGITFGIMTLVVALGVYLAVLQNALVLALMATAGGFIAPLITSSGSNNYIGLFTFYLILNIGVLLVAWFKTWRLLNWIGFVFTFVIFSGWALSKYEPSNYYTVQPFLIAYYAFYLTISVLFSLKQPPKLTGIVDGSLLFGMPIAAFGLQAKLLNHTEYGLAYSALTLSIIYCCLTFFLWKKYKETHSLLLQSFMALSVTFGTLAIPLAFNAKWTSASWALEAIGLIWVGLKQQRLRSRLAGCFLYIAAVISLLIDGVSSGQTLFITGDFFSIMLLSISAISIGYVYVKFTNDVKAGENQISYFFMNIGWLWLLGAGFLELNGHLEKDQLYWASLLWMSTASIIISSLNKPLQWDQLTHIRYWLLPLSVIWILSHIPEFIMEGLQLHPFNLINSFAYGAVFITQYGYLYKEKDSERFPITKFYHIGTAWFLFLLFFWETYWVQNHFMLNKNQTLMLWFGSFSLPLIFLLLVTKLKVWPFVQYERNFKNEIPLPLMVCQVIWFAVICSVSGTEFYYNIPIFNPFDLSMIGSVLILYWAYKNNFLQLGSSDSVTTYITISAISFIWINIVLLRAMHYYQNIPYEANSLWNDSVVQMALSILWSLCALIVMKVSQSRKNRDIWKAGAGLLTLVVIKLFFKDLDGQGTLARVISFMAVGGLMLLIGYLAPLPAKVKDASHTANEPDSKNN